MVVIGAVTFTVVVKGIVLFKLSVTGVTPVDVTTDVSTGVVVVLPAATVLCGAAVSGVGDTFVTTSFPFLVESAALESLLLLLLLLLELPRSLYSFAVFSVPSVSRIGPKCRLGDHG